MSIVEANCPQPTFQTLTAPEKILEFVNYIFSQLQSGKQNDERVDDRKQAFLPVTLQPLDAKEYPICDPIEAITRDISVGGLGFISPEEVMGEKLMVVFQSGRATALIIDVSYQLKRGPFYLIGGEFAVDWS